MSPNSLKEGMCVCGKVESTGVADEMQKKHLGVYKHTYIRHSLCDCKAVHACEKVEFLEAVTSHQRIERMAPNDFPHFISYNCSTTLSNVVLVYVS